MKKSLLIFSLSLLLIGCQKEEFYEEEQKYEKAENEFIDYIKDFYFSKDIYKNKTGDIAPVFELIKTERLINSDKFIRTVPVRIKNSKGYSRIVMVKEDSKIDAVIFTLYPTKIKKERISKAELELVT